MTRSLITGLAMVIGLIGCSTQPTTAEEAACDARGGTMVISSRTISSYCLVGENGPKAPKGQPQYDAGGPDAHLAMTTNERLGYFGLLEDFEQAAKARDRAGMVAALQGAKFERQDAEGIADTTLADPAKYGF